MIVAPLAQADRYVAAHPLLAAALDFLRTADWAALPDGRHDLQGDRLFVILARSEGRGREASPLEFHRRYIDVQYVIEGQDSIGWLPLSECRRPRDEFSSDNDVGFYEDRPETWVQSRPVG